MEQGKASLEPQGYSPITPRSSSWEATQPRLAYLLLLLTLSTPAHPGEERPVRGDKPARTRFFCHE